MGLSNLSIRWRHLSVNFSWRKLVVFSSNFSNKMNNVHNTMSSDNAVSGKYSAPQIPKTPSSTINNMLEARFNHSFDNTFKYGLAVYICTVFTAINTIYGYINQKKPAVSHTFWMASCGIVSTLLIIKSYLVYQILMISAAIMASLMWYAFVAIGLAGAVFFDKEGVKLSTPKFSAPASTPAQFTESKLEEISLAFESFSELNLFNDLI